jgi:hypothetical protein
VPIYGRRFAGHDSVPYKANGSYPDWLKATMRYVGQRVGQHMLQVLIDEMESGLSDVPMRMSIRARSKNRHSCTFPSSRAPGSIGVTHAYGTKVGYMSISAATITRYVVPPRETTPRNPRNCISTNEENSEKHSSTSRHPASHRSGFRWGHQ